MKTNIEPAKLPQRDDFSKRTVVSVNHLLDEIIVFPDRYRELLPRLDVSDRALALPRLQNLIMTALKQNPSKVRTMELRKLHETIAAQLESKRHK